VPTVPQARLHRPSGPDPTDDLPDPSEVPTDLRVTFWLLVFLIKVTLIATTVGLLFIVVEDNWDLGGPLLGLGALCFLFAIVRYRRFRRSEAAEDSSGPAD